MSKYTPSDLVVTSAHSGNISGIFKLMVPVNEIISDNFYFPSFGSYFAFELYMTTCNLKNYIRWIFKLKYTQCVLDQESEQDELEFWVRAVYDDTPIPFPSCEGLEFCPVKKALKFFNGSTMFISKGILGNEENESIFKRIC